MEDDETDSGYSTCVTEQSKMMPNSNGALIIDSNKLDEKVGNAQTELKRPPSLQRKIEKQWEAARSPTGRNKQGYSPISKQPKRSALVSRQRLAVPWKTSALDQEPSAQPLVSIDSESEEEFDIIALTSSYPNQDVKEQLIKDGYRLDEIPDDEELDLIPPRPMNERCICCQTQVNCSIQ